MADQNKPMDASKVREVVKEAVDGLDDAALDGVAGGKEDLVHLTCIVLCGGKEKEKAE